MNKIDKASFEFEIGRAYTVAFSCDVNACTHKRMKAHTYKFRRHLKECILQIYFKVTIARLVLVYQMVGRLNKNNWPSVTRF